MLVFTCVHMCTLEREMEKLGFVTMFDYVICRLRLIGRTFKTYMDKLALTFAHVCVCMYLFL